MYGHPVELYINSHSKVRSKLGAFLSLMIYGSCLLSFVISLIRWQNGQNLQTISSLQSFTAMELLETNQSFIYEMDSSNFYPYFSMFADFLNGTTLNYEILQPFFTQSFSYIDFNGAETQIDFEKCLNRNIAAFLMIDYDNSGPDYNKTTNYTVCLKDNTTLQMGLEVDSDQTALTSPSLVYRISKCQNSTENNNFCASEDEIAHIMKFIVVQTSIPKSIYDFNNPMNPRKRSYDNRFYKLDYSLTKTLNVALFPAFVYLDHGMIEEEYDCETIDFNMEYLNYDLNSRGQSNDILFEQHLTIGLTQQAYYRKNEKLNSILASFGGIINLLFLIGRFICNFYNRMILKYQLINIAFANLDKKEEINREYIFYLYTFFITKTKFFLDYVMLSQIITIPASIFRY